MARYPWFKFYWSDWHTDGSLMKCSAEARGVWLEILGLLYTNDWVCIANDARMIANLSCLDRDEVKRALAELEKHGVFSTDNDGNIVSRRICKDKRISIIRSDAAKVRYKSEKFCRNFAMQNHMQNTASASASDSSSIRESSIRESSIGESSIRESNCNDGCEIVTHSVQSREESSTIADTGRDIIPDELMAGQGNPKCSPVEARTLSGNTNTAPAPRKCRGEAGDAKFEVWFAAYPRKVNREDAEKAWRQVTVLAPAHKRATADEIIDGTRQQVSTGFFSREKKYIPYPATFLRAYSFRNEVDNNKVFGVPFAHDAPLTMEPAPDFVKAFTGATTKQGGK